MGRWWRTYGKSAVALVLTVVTALHAALSDSTTGGRVTEGEWLAIAVAATTAAGVYLVPNVPRWPWAKSVVALLLAALEAATLAIVDGWTTADLTMIILAALGALSIGFAPAHVSNSEPNAVRST